MRVATYARYSSDQQSAASIPDQLAACRRFVEGKGWTVVAEFSDAAISGSSLDRPGIHALRAAATAGAFDAVVCESLDRLSRDQEDTAGLYKRLTFAGIAIVTLSEGEIGELHVGFKSTMNALYLKDLADKTRRGLRARVLAGKSGGGICYGYGLVAGQTGERQIHSLEAAIVRRIFEEYIAGRSPKAIAKRLNAEGVPGPRGAAWGGNTINGHAGRGTGLLNNELYVGRIVWNRQRFVKVPGESKRIARQNPPALWERVDVPALRIVDEATWQAAKDRQAQTRHASTPFNRKARPRYLFSGLTICGVCGKGFTNSTHDALACVSSREHGTCGNRLTIKRAEVERRVLAALRDGFLQPAAYAAFCETFTATVSQHQASHRSTLATAQRDVAAVRGKIARLLAALEDGAAAPAVLSRIAALEAEQAQLEQALRAPAPAAPRPDLAALYRARVDALIEAYTPPDGGIEAIRALVRRIVLRPIGGGLEVLLFGHVSAVVALATGTDGRSMQTASRPRNHLDLPLPLPIDLVVALEAAKLCEVRA